MPYLSLRTLWRIFPVGVFGISLFLGLVAPSTNQVRGATPTVPLHGTDELPY
jgi:hypothetical protein